jgi:hypothetical protein
MVLDHGFQDEIAQYTVQNKDGSLPVDRDRIPPQHRRPADWASRILGLSTDRKPEQDL